MGKKKYVISPEKRRQYWQTFVAKHGKRKRVYPAGKSAEWARQWAAKNPEKDALRHRRHNAKGWAPGEFEKAEIALAKATCCELCGSTKPRHKNGWCRDHCHTTKKFRGILCNPCNVMLGHLETGWELPPLERLAKWMKVTTPQPAWSWSDG
jgi:Recombination endonuclease VII